MDDEDQESSPDDSPAFAMQMGPIFGGLGDMQGPQGFPGFPGMPGIPMAQPQEPDPAIFAGIADECPADLPDLGETATGTLAELEVAARAQMEREALRAALIQARCRVIALLERRRLFRYLRDKGAKRIPNGWASWDSALLDIEGDLAAAKSYLHKVQLFALQHEQRQRKG